METSTIVTVIIAIVAVAGGGMAGWRAAHMWMNKKMLDENIFLQDQNERLKETITYWSNQANYNSQVQQSTINNHNTNLEQTLSAVLILLDNIQKQEHKTIKEEEKEKVSALIQRIKSMAS